MAKKSGKNVYLVALLLFLGGVGYLAYSGFSENSVYFLNVSEALATPSDKLKAARGRLFYFAVSKIEKRTAG